MPVPLVEHSELPVSLASRLPADVRREIRLDPVPRTEAYKQRAKSLLTSLKAIRDPDELLARRIPLDGGSGYLVPVCELHAADELLIATLARWRQSSMSVHPTQFTVTLDGTATWIRTKVLDLEGRILFLVVGSGGKLVGHYGLMDAVNDDCEVFMTNGLRGVPGLYPGIIGLTRRKIIDWATTTLGARRILSVIFADNQRSIRNLRRDGFRQLRVLPLRRRVIGDRIEYHYRTEADRDPPDKNHVLLAYERGGRHPRLTAGSPYGR
jgi:perosamine synthetase